MPNKKRISGKVVSNKMDKTIVVEVERLLMHSLYNKSMVRAKRVLSHDERNECSIGDMVIIEETRPISKEKRYRLIEVTQKVQ